MLQVKTGNLIRVNLQDGGIWNKIKLEGLANIWILKEIHPFWVSLSNKTGFKPVSILLLDHVL